jgi:hypothetical protein
MLPHLSHVSFASAPTAKSQVTDRTVLTEGVLATAKNPRSTPASASR